MRVQESPTTIAAGALASASLGSWFLLGPRYPVLATIILWLPVLAVLYWVWNEYQYATPVRNRGTCAPLIARSALFTGCTFSKGSKT